VYQCSEDGADGERWGPMKPSQIEAWALRVVERVETGQPNEDSRVELKREWPAEPDKAARRIAGQANAARGEPALWLIGLDQTAGVTGAAHADLAKWWPGVKAEFEGLAPVMVDLNVPWKGLTVVALLFETDRAPFVVKNPVYGKPNGGPVALEVPWRDGTLVRSARRDELLRLLAPLQLLPDVEVLNGWLHLEKVDQPTDPASPYIWELWLDLYVVPRGEERLTIPFHRCQGAIDLPAPASQVVAFEEVSLRPHYSPWFPPRSPSRKLSVTVESTHTEVHFDGPGNAILTARAGTLIDPSTFPHVPEVHTSVSLLPIGAERRVTIENTLRLEPLRFEGGFIAWRFGKHPRVWRPDMKWQ
jgi:hypothetical protein